MEPLNQNKTGYAYNFGPDTPLWRYLFLGALVPFTTLRVVAKLQHRTIPRWQYITFCSIGVYLGGKHAFNNARVPINPDDMQSIQPFGFNAQQNPTFNYQIWTKDANGDKWERHKLPRRDRPSLDDVIDSKDNEYNDGYYDGYRAAMEQSKKYKDDNNDHDNTHDTFDSYDGYSDYGEYRTSKRKTEDPNDEISEFFESNDKKRRPRNR